MVQNQQPIILLQLILLISKNINEFAFTKNYNNTKKKKK